MAYIVGQNMPGYLPESEPYAYDSFTAARDDLIARLFEHEEDTYIADLDTEDPDITAHSREYRTARGELRRARARDGGVTVYAGNLAYWIHDDPSTTADQYNNVEGWNE